MKKKKRREKNFEIVHLLFLLLFRFIFYICSSIFFSCMMFCSMLFVLCSVYVLCLFQLFFQVCVCRRGRCLLLLLFICLHYAKCGSNFQFHTEMINFTFFMPFGEKIDFFVMLHFRKKFGLFYIKVDWLENQIIFRLYKIQY